MGSMDKREVAAATELETDLEGIAASVWAIVRQHQGQSTQILAILRLLERLHQEIRDSFFQDALPDNRQALYALLRDIELSGGWPYIHRMKLQAFLAHVLSEFAELPAEGAMPPAESPASAPGGEISDVD